MSSKLWRNVALAGVAAAGAAVWAVAPRTFNDKRRNFVPSIPEVWYAHRGLHDAGSGLVGYTDIADYGGDNPVSAQADTTERSIAENDDYVSLARRMAVKAGYGSADMTGPIARWPRSPPPARLAMASNSTCSLRSTAKWSWSMTPICCAWPAIRAASKT